MIWGIFKLKQAQLCHEMKFQYMFFFKLKQAQLYHEMKSKIQDRIENFSL